MGCKRGTGSWTHLEAGCDAQVTGYLQKSALAFEKQRLVDLR
jgi:hypothetical protein